MLAVKVSNGARFSHALMLQNQEYDGRQAEMGSIEDLDLRPLFFYG
jgi:hypothetical protein